VENSEFFDRIAGALVAARGTVITGPGSTESGLLQYLDQTHPGIGAQSGRVDPCCAARIAP
jgi:hypothetical protein